MKKLITVDRLLDRKLTIGLTGLSKSGKSTLITSLINQLVHHDKSKIPGFSPVRGGELLGVRILPLKDKNLAPFPYEKARNNLCEPNPAWPDSTKDISGCLLELRLTRKPRAINLFKRKNFSLYLELRDYPGEWLLDLPLRDMSFSRWSAQCHALYSSEPRAGLIGNLLLDLQEINPLDLVDEKRIKILNGRFKDFLKKCKMADKSLSQIQPGRFLLHGKIPDKSILGFVPLFGCAKLSEAQLSSAKKNSYYKYCERLYKRYVKELIDPFYKIHFGKIDRQLVLVDVINVLNSGPRYVDDLRQALANISDSFSYGKQSRLRQLFTPKIDKVVFVATKIDQVLSEDHEAVRQLLALLVKQAYSDAAYAGIAPQCEAVAAVRSSAERPVRKQRAILGIDLFGKNIGYRHPKIPSQFPETDKAWKPFLKWSIPKLQPPVGISARNEDPLPHIRMDSLLNILIGDKCL